MIKMYGDRIVVRLVGHLVDERHIELDTPVSKHTREVVIRLKKGEDQAKDTERNLLEGYRQMAEDEARETEALQWAEATVGDVGNETR
jgi:hypothetical protein